MKWVTAHTNNQIDIAIHCLKNVLEKLKEIKQQSGLNQMFLSVDVGSFGSDYKSAELRRLNKFAFVKQVEKWQKGNFFRVWRIILELCDKVSWLHCYGTKDCWS